MSPARTSSRTRPRAARPRERGAASLAAIGLPIRREMLRLVWREELAAGDIAGRFDVTFGAVSQHLRVLRDAGLVRVRAQGRHRFYRADRRALGPFADALEAFWGERLDRIRGLAERRAGKEPR